MSKYLKGKKMHRRFTVYFISLSVSVFWLISIARTTDENRLTPIANPATGKSQQIISINALPCAGSAVQGMIGLTQMFFLFCYNMC